jgi:D-3-phosphoglycerate dehydrogenase
MIPNIYNLEPDGYSRKAAGILQSLGAYHPRRISTEQVDVVITRLTPIPLTEYPRLGYIVTATTGLDHIDLPECERRGITVLSLQGETQFLETIPATAEHTWGLMLALLRHIPWAFTDVKAGRWDRMEWKGGELRGRKLGILGAGRVGSQILGYANAFGMDVRSYDRDSTMSLDDFMGHCEILTIHLPLTEETRMMIGARELALMPEGSYLVNTSRGAIVDEDALLTALDSRHLTGAALDVLTDEGRGLIFYAQTHSNLLITPHLGGCTWESMERTEEYMALKLKRVLKEKAICVA